MTSLFLSILNNKHKRSVFDEILFGLDEDSKKDFLLALQDKAISSPTITKTLQEMGLTISAVSLNRIRKTI